MQFAVGRERVPRFPHSRVRTWAHPHGDGIPPVRTRPGGRLLMRYDPVQEWRSVGVRALQQQAVFMPDEPSVQRLHPHEVRDDDVLVGDVRSSHRIFTRP